MPVTGLVIVLDQCSDSARGAIDAVRGHGRFVLGPDETPGRRPAVLDTATVDEDARAVKWLKELPGVALVEIAYHDFRDAGVPPAPPSATRRDGHER